MVLRWELSRLMSEFGYTMTILPMILAFLFDWRTSTAFSNPIYRPQPYTLGIDNAMQFSEGCLR